MESKTIQKKEKKRYRGPSPRQAIKASEMSAASGGGGGDGAGGAAGQGEPVGGNNEFEGFGVPSPGDGKADTVVLDRSGGKKLGIVPMPATADGLGLAIESVEAGGQTEATRKLEADAVITHVNGTDVTSMAMQSIVALIKEKDEVTFTVLAPGEVNPAHVPDCAAPHAPLPLSCAQSACAGADQPWRTAECMAAPPCAPPWPVPYTLQSRCPLPSGRRATSP